MSTLQLDPARIFELTEQVKPSLYGDHRLVAVSAGMYVNPTTTDRARFRAALTTASGSRAAGVPHVFMLDAQSAPDVGTQLTAAGGIVVPVEAGEGGLARPYLTASSIVDELVSGGMLPAEVHMVKVEGEKPIFSGDDSAAHYLAHCSGLEVVSGVRTPNTWRTMPSYLALTESVLADIIEELIGIPDAPSGVLVLGSEGRRILRETTEADDWTYLMKTPFEASRRSVACDSLPVTFEYFPEVSAAENGNSSVDEKRRQQLTVMAEYTVRLAEEQSQGMSARLARLFDRFSIALPGVCSSG